MAPFKANSSGFSALICWQPERHARLCVPQVSCLVLSPTIVRPPEHFELASIGFTVAIADIHRAAGLSQ